MATLTVVDATMLMAQPWDAKQIPAIERGAPASRIWGSIRSSDGKVVRIPDAAADRGAPQGAGQEGARDRRACPHRGSALARREANDKLKKLEKDHELGQDDERRALEDVQKLHDREIDEVAQGRSSTRKKTS